MADLLGEELLQPLRFHAVVYVGVGAEPADQLPRRVPERSGSRQEPMIFAVVTSQRIGIFPIGARFPRPAEAFDDPIGMVGMDGLGPAPARHLLRIGAGEPVPSPIVPATERASF